MRPVAAPRLGRVFAGAAALSAVTALLPPVATGASHYLWMEGLQFLLLACALPALVALALPARWKPLRTGRTWMTAALLAELAVLALWRSKAAVDGIAHHPWLSLAEAVCLLAGGIPLWSFLLATPSREQALPSYPWRMALAAFAMWSIWILAYLVGFSSTAWYPAYASRSGLSVSAEQQITTGLLWVGAGLAFLPVIFWCLWQWLAPEKTRRA